MTRSLLAFLVLSLACAAPATAPAEEHDGPAGAVFVPDDMKKGEVLPVLVVEKGLAKQAARVWETLSSRTRLVVAETVSLRGAVGKPAAEKLVGEAVLAALAQAARHIDVAKCPVVLLGFSDAGPATMNTALAHTDRVRGLLLVNSKATASHLPKGLESGKKLKVGILHGTKDPVFPIGPAEKLSEKLEGAGFDVTFGKVETSDHVAPLGEAGADFIVKFLESLTAKPGGFRTVETKAADGLLLTADLYETGDNSAPVILLFHQARSSRGEYRPIAPRLALAGYNCLALDQRSGKEWEGVTNETAARAEAKGIDREYVDARPDLDRAVAWARELGFAGKLAIWGSSYSSALVLFMAADLPALDAVLSFSPGDYLPPRGSVFDAAGRIEEPVLVVCPPNEEAQARKAFDALPSNQKELIVHRGGVHGSSTLYRGEGTEDLWKKVLAFLAKRLK